MFISFESESLINSRGVRFKALNEDSLIPGRIQLQDIVEKGFYELVNNKVTNIKIIVSPT